jgi:diketogulonate reductase-like aldo/keto reductase
MPVVIVLALVLGVIGASARLIRGRGEPPVVAQAPTTFADNGGSVYDAMHGNAIAEEFHATVAKELGIQNKLFWSTRGTAPDGPAQPGPAAVKAHIDTWLARIKAAKMDLVMLPPQGDAAWLAALKEEKKAGRVRYIGVQVIGDNVYPQLESVMRNEPIDFIGVDYDIGNRDRVEDTILPLAMERKIGVMAFFPFGNNGGVSCSPGTRNLFARVGKTPLPEWAADFDAKTWSHFFTDQLSGVLTVQNIRFVEGREQITTGQFTQSRDLFAPPSPQRITLSLTWSFRPPGQGPRTQQQQQPAGPPPIPGAGGPG